MQDSKRIEKRRRRDCDRAAVNSPWPWYFQTPADIVAGVFIVVLQILRMKIAKFFTGEAGNWCAAAEVGRLGPEITEKYLFPAKKCVVRATVEFNLFPDARFA